VFRSRLHRDDGDLAHRDAGISAGLGGYLAGRLRIGGSALIRTRSFFRDTAHGLVTWAVCDGPPPPVGGLSVLRWLAVAYVSRPPRQSKAHRNDAQRKPFTASHDTDNASYGLINFFARRLLRMVLRACETASRGRPILANANFCG